MRPLPRVLIIDDEPAVAELLSVRPWQHGFMPTWAKDERSAQRELDFQLPDVILLDWMLPGEDGLLLTRKWRADHRTRRVPIVMLTARGDESDKVAALDAGADDYVTKPFSTPELLARMRAVIRRNSFDSASTVSVGSLSLNEFTHCVNFDGQEVALGPAEFKLLWFFMKHAERTHTRSQLLEMVWPKNVRVDVRAVDVQIKRLREALGEGASMIETIRGAGYRLRSNF